MITRQSRHKKDKIFYCTTQRLQTSTGYIDGRGYLTDGEDGGTATWTRERPGENETERRLVSPFIGQDIRTALVGPCAQKDPHGGGSAGPVKGKWGERKSNNSGVSPRAKKGSLSSAWTAPQRLVSRQPNVRRGELVGMPMHTALCYAAQGV